MDGARNVRGLGDFQVATEAGDRVPREFKCALRVQGGCCGTANAGAGADDPHGLPPPPGHRRVEWGQQVGKQGGDRVHREVVATILIAAYALSMGVAGIFGTKVEAL